MTDAPYHHGDLRRALLHAAEGELATSGLEGFSLRKVAKRAGVSHAAPAHHFKDINGLLTALAAKGYDIFLAYLKEQIPQNATAKDRIVGMGIGYVNFATSRRALFRLMFSSDRPDYDDPDLAQAAQLTLAHFTEAVESIIGSDPQQSGTAMSHTISLWSAAHGIADLMASGTLDLLTPLSPAEKDLEIRKALERTLPWIGATQEIDTASQGLHMAFSVKPR